MKVEEARRKIEEGRSLNAFISLTDETGDGPVVAVKDLVDVRGTVTTAGSVLLPSEPASTDAVLIGELRRHGCVMVGKTNLHEWAFGITSNNPHHGPVRNPADPDRIPGGSSGGSAAAVVAGMCDWAVGSDTGGSIRWASNRPWAWSAPRASSRSAARWTRWVRSPRTSGRPPARWR
ncbi:MAG: hypothetical protein E6J29_12280 [Chloroflexi bacterium]|nr:MAG: hypothetical protein E6J29_12280 [Chloroflexota bacterium]